MRIARSVLPLAIVAGALYFAAPVYSEGRGGPRPAPAANKQTNSQATSKNIPAEQTDQRVSKKEARMKQRDKEMDKRMKPEKLR
jgi:hypothetical protein